MDEKIDTFVRILLADEKQMLFAFGFDTYKQAKRKCGYKSKKEMMDHMRGKAYFDIFGGMSLIKVLDNYYGCYLCEESALQ